MDKKASKASGFSNIRRRTLRVGLYGNVAAIGAFAALGTYLLRSSSAAATSNPVGYLDNCQLVNGTTVIYGWASDQDAAAGSLPNVVVHVAGLADKTVPTNLNYRAAQIDNYLKQRGMATSSIYGYTATYTGIYKGETHAISATGVNVGAGANAVLSINTTTYVDGDTSKPYFIGNKIPDDCMPTKPIVVPPTPTPTPTPTPVPNPVPTPVPVTNPTPAPKTTTTTNKTTPKTTTPATVSSDSNADVTPGTLGATMTIPTGNAQSVQIAYGDVQDNLSQTQDATIDGGNATLTLSDLNATQTYYYQIVRTSGTTTTTSPVSSFTTKGYEALITLGTSHKLANTAVSIPELNKKTTSDGSGIVALSDVPPGSYTLKFDYQKAHLSRSFTVPGDQILVSDQRGVYSVNITIDPVTGKTTTTVTKAKKSSSIAPIFIILPLLLAFGGLLFFLYRRGLLPIFGRRNNQAAMAQYDLGTLPITNQPPQQLQPPLPTHASQVPSGDLHIGESLKDLVLKSMAEEAARRRQSKK